MLVPGGAGLNDKEKVKGKIIWFSLFSSPHFPSQFPVSFPPPPPKLISLISFSPKNSIILISGRNLNAAAQPGRETTANRVLTELLSSKTLNSQVTSRGLNSRQQSKASDRAFFHSGEGISGSFLEKGSHVI